MELFYKKKLPVWFLRHGVISATTPRMTPEQTLYRQPESLERAMLPDCLHGIFGAGGNKTARWWRERRNTGSVESDGKKQQKGKSLAEYSPDFFHCPV